MDGDGVLSCLLACVRNAHYSTCLITLLLAEPVKCAEHSLRKLSPFGAAHSIVSLAEKFACTVAAIAACHDYCVFTKLPTSDEMG